MKFKNFKTKSLTNSEIENVNGGDHVDIVCNCFHWCCRVTFSWKNFDLECHKGRIYIHGRPDSGRCCWSTCGHG